MIHYSFSELHSTVHVVHGKAGGDTLCFFRRELHNASNLVENLMKRFDRYVGTCVDGWIGGLMGEAMSNH